VSAPLVLTQEPEPWKLVRARHPELASAAVVVHVVRDVDKGLTLERTESWRSAAATCVIGIGGGMALDHAKFTAWHLELPLVRATMLTLTRDFAPMPCQGLFWRHWLALPNGLVGTTGVDTKQCPQWLVVPTG